MTYINNSAFYNGKYIEPSKDGARCLVLIGVDEKGNEIWDFLIWREKYKSFEWNEKINGKTAYFPAENFEKWAYEDAVMKGLTLNYKTYWTSEKLQDEANTYCSNVSYTCPRFRDDEAMSQIKNAFLQGCRTILGDTTI